MTARFASATTSRYRSDADIEGSGASALSAISSGKASMPISLPGERTTARDEFSSDDEPLGWDAEGWEKFA
jgi:hypothetical protein